MCASGGFLFWRRGVSLESKARGRQSACRRQNQLELAPQDLGRIERGGVVTTAIVASILLGYGTHFAHYCAERLETRLGEKKPWESLSGIEAHA
jgi:hypothetical protein